MTEKWKHALDKGNKADTIFMDLNHNLFMDLKHP